MLTGLPSSLVHITPDSRCTLLLALLLTSVLCVSRCASTRPAVSSQPFELMSNSSYRNFILRQYFIDLLNISHTSLVRSMTYTHQLTSPSITAPKSHRRRRRGLATADAAPATPLFTVQASTCSALDKQVQSTFLWSHSTDSLASIELVYHIDSVVGQQPLIPLRLKFRRAHGSAQLLAIDAYLQFDSSRDFHSINIFEYVRSLRQDNLVIESSIAGETCQTSHTYMIVSSTGARAHARPEPSPSSSSSSSTCRVRTIQIKFEDLGLAYLIIRPREYAFTYCDGACTASPSASNQPGPSSMHAVLQSIINAKHPGVPAPTCAPSQFADENFLLRQIDGTIEIHPIKDVIVKQCACL